MALFNILVDIAARTASFETGLQRVEKRLDAFSAGATRLAARASGVIGVSLGFEALRRSVAGAVQRGDDLNRLAERMRTTTEFLSEMRFVAQQTGNEFGALAGNLDTFAKNVGTAVAGSVRMQRVFRSLGVDVRELSTLPLDRQLEVIADRIAAIENPARQTAIAMQLFGSADVLSALRGGSAGLRAMREQAVALGQSLDRDAAQKLKEVDEAVKRLQASGEALSNRSATFFAPFIAGAADAARRLLGGATQLEILQDKLRFLREQQETIPIIFDVGFLSDGVTVLGPQAVEDKITEIEDRIRRLSRTSGRGSGGNRGHLQTVAAPTIAEPSAEALRRVNQYSRLWLQFADNLEFVESIERQLTETAEYHQKVREDLLTTIERGIQEGITETLRQTGASIEEVGSRMEEAIVRTNELSTFAEQAARNIQDHFANFLFDPFEDGLKGMLRGFIDVIRRMIAEVAAAGILKSLFGGTRSDGTSGLGGFLGSLFGGFLAEGGPLEPGKWHIAGEHGPEPIWGGGPGAFAAGYGPAGGGAIVVRNENHFHNMRDVTDQKMLAYAERISDATVARIKDERRRGTF